MYTSLEILLSRFGAAEIVRLTNDRTLAPVDPQELTSFAEGEASPTDDVARINAVVVAAIEDAEALIDSYLVSRYDLPLPEDKLASVLTKTASDIARFYLHAKTPTETVKAAHERALEWLSAVARGRASAVVVHLGASESDRPLRKDTGGSIARTEEETAVSVFGSSKARTRYIDGY